MIRAGLALAAALSASAAVAYRTGPPPGYTGAFGEPDCAACHFDAVRDDTTGETVVDGPDLYEPGRTYTVTVEVRHPELAAAGFQLTARFRSGARAGQQAGSLEPTGSRTQVQRGGGGGGADGGDSIEYASHTAEGVTPKHGGAKWAVRWTAPADGGAVAFDVAAQVANDDASEFGERLYLARHVSRPSPASGR